ncbi:unnamed protein product [Caenorhabditis bovis]|uniref:mRNA-decapping enzyme C-terminal domain-containing protein n=1 Tax=Caenorhabditis bovis TaxID=2654633 RepID=A0A8S1F1H0_9PELO|nr:unnamed protein product [Caenorhabditis bovis]
MSDAKKKAVAAELAAKNLAQIQKIDPCASKILDKVAHTALYKFNKEKNQWEKTDIDGTMFIYSRVDRPLYSIMIANRQSPDDYIEPITASLQINVDNNYLFFCKTDGTINGLWFYDQKDTKRIAGLVQKLIEKVEKSQESGSPKSSAATAQAAQSIDDRSAQLMNLIRGGKHNAIKQPTTPKKDPPSEFSTPKTLMETPTSSISRTSLKPDPTPVLPVLLQKLMVQEQPRNLLKEPGAVVSADELEKDLLKTARPKQTQFADFINSPSAVSLNAFSTKSVHGSEGGDSYDVCSKETNENVEASFVVGSGSNTPPLNKEQFASALIYMFQNDDQFVSQLHQAYVDSLNRRFRL